MTLDEAIIHAREKAKEKRKEMQCKTCKLFVRSDLHPLQGYCRKNEFHSIEIDSWSKVCSEYVPKEMCKCAEEYEQIAEWLEELKIYQQHEIICNKGYNAGYNKAIDDFAENISLEISESIIWGMLVNSHKDNSFNDTSDKIVDYVINTANEIAEQLKVGGENE